MRITNITLYSNLVETVSFGLHLTDPAGKYIIREIAGIDAEEIIPKFYGFGLASTKPRFYDFSMKPRNVVIRVVLNPRFKIDETFSEVRDELYRNISADRTGLVTMHFNSGGTTVARLMGYVIKFEVSHFTQLPEAQITILCN
ncbi:MAG: hypothetical protein ABWY25_10765, partial [Paenisporosarcina sp.]